jgi:hypothetical protein
MQPAVFSCVTGLHNWRINFLSGTSVFRAYFTFHKSLRRSVLNLVKVWIEAGKSRRVLVIHPLTRPDMCHWLCDLTAAAAAAAGVKIKT